MTDMLKAALEYAERGWAVFPLLPRGKTPLVGGGFKSATTDPFQIEDWWKRWPDANIGIATGAVSGLVVLDFDKKHGGLETLSEEEAGLPLTMEVATGGGGRHLYYGHPGLHTPNRQGLLPGMDVRGDGGYVVAPPSVHESGGSYKLDTQLGLGTIQALPAWVGEMLATPAREARELPGRAAVGAPEEKGELAKSTLAFIANGAGPGLWHAAFFKAAIDLKQNMYTQEEAVELLSKATGHLDDTDLAQLEDVYANREPRHPPRIEEKEEGEKPLLIRASALAGSMIAHLSDKSKVKGLPTGIPGLDALLGGGKRLGEVTCWHAEAKTGKNTLWHKLMFTWLEQGIPIGYASRELSPDSEVVPNLLSLAENENAWLADMTERRKKTYAERLERWPLYFAEGYGHFPLEQIKRWMDEAQKAGIQYYWFDHLHYMLEDPEEHKEASKLIKELKAMSKERNVHIDIIIQPNKLMEGQRLSLNSIKGGSAMGQAIDNLITLERVSDQKDMMKLTLKAARSKLAKLGDVFLKYDRETTDFQEMEPVDEPASPPPPTPAKWGTDRMLSA
jgi:hypothetical protein